MVMLSVLFCSVLFCSGPAACDLSLSLSLSLFFIVHAKGVSES